MQRRVADTVIKLRWARVVLGVRHLFEGGNPRAVGVGVEGSALPAVSDRSLRGRRGTGGAGDRRTEAVGHRHRRSLGPRRRGFKGPNWRRFFTRPILVRGVVSRGGVDAGVTSHVCDVSHSVSGSSS